MYTLVYLQTETYRTAYAYIDHEGALWDSLQVIKGDSHKYGIDKILDQLVMYLW